MSVVLYKECSRLGISYTSFFPEYLKPIVDNHSTGCHISVYFWPARMEGLKGHPTHYSGAPLMYYDSVWESAAYRFNDQGKLFGPQDPRLDAVFEEIFSNIRKAIEHKKAKIELDNRQEELRIAKLKKEEFEQAVNEILLLIDLKDEE